MTTVARADMVLDARTQGFVRDMNKAQQTARRFAREAKDAEGASAQMAGGLKRAANAAAILTGPFGGVSSRLSFLSTGFASAGAAATAFGVALSAAVAVAIQGARVFSDYERQMNRQDALLKSTALAAGRTSRQLEMLAESVARATLASQSGIRDAIAVLLTFKTVQGPAFDQAIRLSQDLASVMGGDAKSAALQLGKALEDPATGLTALKRSGVSFTQAERDMIKSMQEAGKVAEAQGLILQKLAEQVGGAASGEGKGLAGAVDSLAHSWENLQKSIGGSSLVQDVAGGIVTGAQNLIKLTQDSLFPADSFKVSDAVRQLLEIEGELQRMRSGGVTLYDIFIGDLPADLEQQKAALIEVIREGKKRGEAMREEEASAQRAAKQLAENAEQERKKTQEKNKQLEIMQQQLKLMQQMNGGGSGGLYKKLFGDGAPAGKLIDHSAFNSYAIAAKRAKDSGNDAEFKRLISSAADVLGQVSKSGSNGIFRYDMAGMRDVLTRLTGGKLQLNQEKHTIEFKIQDKSITMFGDGQASTAFVKAFKDALSNEAALIGVN